MKRNRLLSSCLAAGLCLILLQRDGACEDSIEKLRNEGRAAAGAMPRLETRFTLGVWGTPWQWYADRGANGLDDVKRHYMNLISQLGVWSTRDTTERYLLRMREYVARADKLGLHFSVHCQGLLPRKDSQPWDIEAAARIARERLLPLKDAEPVLGWYLCDEAPFDPGFLKRFLQLKLFLQKEAPSRAPVILLSPSGNPQKWMVDWSPYLNVMLTDLYGYSTGTDMLCVAVNNLTERPHWITLDAFRYYPGPMPDITWPRLKTYIALARGANGVNYYAYGGRSGWEGPGGWALVDAYGNARDGLWDKLGEMARTLEPVGHLLTAAKVVHPPVRLACLKTVQAQPGANQPRSLCLAVDMGVRRDADKDADFLICFNNDTRQPSTASIAIYESYLGDRHVYDLYALKDLAVPKRRHNTSFKMAPLERGDGRIYVICSPKTFEQYKRAILKRRYENERVIAKMDLKWSRRSGLNTSKARASLAQARKQAQAGDFAAAKTSASAAQQALQAALKADAAVNQAYTHMRNAQKALGECDTMLALNVNSIWSLAIASARNKRKLNPLDPKIKPWLNVMLKMSEAYRRLRELEREGHLRKLVEEAKFLAQTCAALRGGIQDLLVGNYILPTYSEDRFRALHDKCDQFRAERFVEWNHGQGYKPYDPRKVAIGDTSSVHTLNSWLSYYRCKTFATEAEAKAYGLKPMK